MADSRYVCLLVLMTAVGIFSEEPFARPPIGPIRGSIVKSRLGKDIYSFRGVRYAEPPTKENRFALAIPAKDWTRAFDASQEGPSCIRPRGSFLSEDCLRLNVYTTKLPSNDTVIRRPVIVFFPPTGVVGYSAQSHVYGPQYLLDKDIVLVTVNSRVCALGYISTGDANAPGNLGMKDQVEALKWIKRNIVAFGGDPESVTITGYGGGSVGVVLHMLSPMSKGLFHRAIAMSGSPLNLTPLPREQSHLAEKQARLLNCPITPYDKTIACLRTKPTEDFRRTIREFFKWDRFPIVLWNPVIEPELPGHERFLTDSPLELIKRGQINRVPLIVGYTEDELGGFTIPYADEMKRGNDSRIRRLNEKWNELSPTAFGYEGAVDTLKINDKLKEFYFQNRTIDLTNMKELGELYSDCWVKFPVHRLAKLMANASEEPVYFYKFTFQGDQSFAMWNNTAPYGVEHQDDLQYLFYMSYRFDYAESNSTGIPMIERMTAIWANYVTNGNPIPENDDRFEGVKWDRFVPELDNYLELNVDPVMKRNLETERMAKLKSLFGGV